MTDLIVENNNITPKVNNIKSVSKNPSIESLSSYTLGTPNSEPSIEHHQLKQAEHKNSYEYIVNNAQHYHSIVIDHLSSNNKTRRNVNLLNQPLIYQTLSNVASKPKHLNTFDDLVIIGDSKQYLNYLNYKLNNLLFFLDINHGYDNVINNLNLNYNYFFTNNPQQDYDISIISTIFNNINQQNLFLLFNMLNISEYESTISTLNNDQLLQFYNEIKQLNQSISLDAIYTKYYELTQRQYNSYQLEEFEYTTADTLILSFNTPVIQQLKSNLNNIEASQGVHLLSIIHLNRHVLEEIAKLIQRNQYKDIVLVNYNENNNNNNNSFYYILLKQLIQNNVQIKLNNLNIQLLEDGINNEDLINQLINTLNKVQQIQSNNNINLPIQFQLIEEVNSPSEPSYTNKFIQDLKLEHSIAIYSTKDTIEGNHFESHKVIINNNILTNNVEVLFLSLKQFYKLPLYLKFNKNIKVVILLSDDNIVLKNITDRIELNNKHIKFYNLRANESQKDYRLLLSLIWYYKHHNLETWFKKQYNINNEQMHIFKLGIQQQLIPINLNYNDFKVEDKLQLKLYNKKHFNLVNQQFKLDINLQPQLPFVFNSSYNTQQVLRPDIENAMVIKVSKKIRLTPMDYDRDVFHIEFDCLPGQQLKYEIGDALAVYPNNPEHELNELLLKYPNFNIDEILLLPNEDNVKVYRTGWQLLQQYLDLFGKLEINFLKGLIEYTKDEKEKQQLILLSSKQGEQQFKNLIEDKISYYDILMQYNSINISIIQLYNLIPKIEPRHYSISSSNKVHPNQVHLLIVLVTWNHSTGIRNGLATHYLNNLKLNDLVTVSIKPSVMKLPQDNLQPIIMAGLGTGMAPFRAFIEERVYLSKQGIATGPIALYFGSRYRKQEYLYGEELDAYQTQGYIQYLRLAFSRDQKNKVYIQDLIIKDKEYLNDWLLNRKAHFYLCGPTWPELDVRNAIKESICLSGYDDQHALQLIEQWKEDERYILELY